MDKVKENFKGGVHNVPPVEIDNKGLIWASGSVLVNLYQASHRVKLADKIASGEVRSYTYNED